MITKLRNATEMVNIALLITNGQATVMFTDETSYLKILGSTASTTLSKHKVKSHFGGTTSNSFIKSALNLSQANALVLVTKRLI